MRQWPWPTEPIPHRWIYTTRRYYICINLCTIYYYIPTILLKFYSSITLSSTEKYALWKLFRLPNIDFKRHYFGNALKFGRLQAQSLCKMLSKLGVRVFVRHQFVRYPRHGKRSQRKLVRRDIKYEMGLRMDARNGWEGRRRCGGGSWLVNKRNAYHSFAVSTIILSVKCRYRTKKLST